MLHNSKKTTYVILRSYQWERSGFGPIRLGVIYLTWYHVAGHAAYLTAIGDIM